MKISQFSTRLILNLCIVLSFGPGKVNAITASVQTSLPEDSHFLRADSHFGLVGAGGAAFAAKFGLTYYTLEGNYAAEKESVFSSVDPVNDPAVGFKVVREVAKLNVRTDGLGQTHSQFQALLTQYTKDLASWYALPAWGRGKKPIFKWYSPDPVALIHAESLQIVETIRREKSRNPAVTGTVWEIGNEPNLFPALLPSEYAAIFSNYYRVIKGEDPTALVAIGALFLPEISQDLKVRFAEELQGKIKAELQAANLYNTMETLGVFSNLVADVKNTVLSRTLAQGTRDYLSQVLNAMTARPDIVTVHAYPYDDRAPNLDSASLGMIIDSTAAGLVDLISSKNVPLSIPDPASGGTLGSLWVTKYGNIEQGLDAGAVATRSRWLTRCFQGNSAFGRWFHYKSTGVDEQFVLFSSGLPPLTRLILDPNFSPPDGNFSCSQLNEVGNFFWRASHSGTACQDPVVIPPSGTVVIANPAPATLALNAPIILNLVGSNLSSSQSLNWGWEVGKESGLDKSTTISLVEFFRDSLSTQPLLRADSLKSNSMNVDLPGGAILVWVRVKSRDSHNHETPWSALKELAWTGVPTTRILAGSAVGFSLKAAPGGRSFKVLRITLPIPASVSVQILDARGQVRRTLYHGNLEAGGHAFPYDGRGDRGRRMSTGLYFCRFEANGEVRTIPTSILL